MTAPVEFLSSWAQIRPDHPAVIDARTDAVLTYRQLDERSRAVAHRWLELGLQPGDHVAFAVANRFELIELYWAAQRIGLYYTAVNTHLTPGEGLGIVADCTARAVVVDAGLPELAASVAAAPGIADRMSIGFVDGCDDYETVASRQDVVLARECEGEKMLYTSGTTGTAKGVARPLEAGPPGSVFLVRPLLVRLGIGADTVLVNPGPLYHAAPLTYTMGTHRLGGTVVIGGRFDAEQCLAAMARHRATHGLFVPTMFVRMLRVPDRERFDLSSLRVAAHGAAPCPIEAKRAMIDWWGPIVHEYYAGTEGAGMTLIEAKDWLAHPGSVGRAVNGAIHIVDDVTGRELPAGETGSVFFSGGARFRYFGDDAKTDAAYDARGWNTLGDVGHLDDEGYLYLTDRKAFTVISGGVNLYPQEVEDVLAAHPDVADVAAFGVPHPDLGEQLIAVVQLLEPDRTGPDVAAQLQAWCEARLARQKCPRRIEFRRELPRADNGKLYKRDLVAEYTDHPGKVRT